MSRSISRWYPVLLLGVILSGCGDSAPPTDPGDPLTGPPDLTVAVFRSTHESGPAPGGEIDQYAVWIGPVGDPGPDAGVVVGARSPVYRRAGDALIPATASAIRPGDVIEVWRETTVAYGAVQAPPGRPCYHAVQVVIRPE